MFVTDFFFLIFLSEVLQQYTCRLVTAQHYFFVWGSKLLRKESSDSIDWNEKKKDTSTSLILKYLTKLPVAWHTYTFPFVGKIYLQSINSNLPTIKKSHSVIFGLDIWMGVWLRMGREEWLLISITRGLASSTDQFLFNDFLPPKGLP